MVEVMEVYEVGVREARDRSKLTLKIVERARIIELELFERDLSIIDRVVDAVHMTHTARAELSQYLIATELLWDRLLFFGWRVALSHNIP